MSKRFFQFFVLAISLEFLLRLFSINETYMESYRGSYDYVFSGFRQTWYHAWPPNSTLEFGEEEFKYTNHYNELGHREIDFKEFEKDTSALKIVCLGDSFTEGDGAPYDSSWVRFFEIGLQKDLDTNVLAYNAGVCGSDVVYNGIMFKEKLSSSKPSFVLECVNKSDITDVYYRGGKERFNEDGTHHFPNAKWWEPIYKYSYLFRLIVCTIGPYDSNLINQRTREKDEHQAANTMATQITETYLFCKSQNIPYYLVLMPVPSDANFRDTVIFQSLPKIIPEAIPLIDLYPSFYGSFDSLDISAYSWKKNGHFNGLGYELMGNKILEDFLALQSKKTLGE